MNLPNALSFFRLCLIPVFPILFFSSYPYANLMAAGVYVLASATDVLDGILARRLHMITRLGRFIDPLADKLMAGMVVFCIAYVNPLVWYAAGVMFLKEILMGVGALVQYKKYKEVSSAEFFGKVSAVILFLVCLAILVFENAISQPMKLLLVSLAIVCSVLSLFLYLRRFLALSKKE